MIVVRLMGGLGNQMFQYAIGRALSLKHNTQLKMDTSFLVQINEIHSKRQYELDIFNLDVTIAKSEELNAFSSVQNSRLKRNLQRFLPISYYTITEPAYTFCPEILKSRNNSLLIGFWQTEKYFVQIADVIRKDFTFKPLQNEVDKQLAAKITSCNSVSIHIRRGDYVSNPETNKYHGICGPEYYKEAIELVRTKENDLQVFLFSDDMQWVKDNMTFNLPVTYVEHNANKNNYIDMQLMAMCKHNIIANSSFSWWAAWLNANTNKIVVAPKSWFADKGIDTSDLISASWKRI